jgi:hypothetical protein
MLLKWSLLELVINFYNFLQTSRSSTTVIILTNAKYYLRF